MRVTPYNQLKFEIKILLNDPPVLNTHPDIHTQLGTDFLPAVKILLLKNEIPKFKESSNIKCASVYHFLRKIIIINTHIDVEVSDFKNVVLQNDTGVLDINKPFQPFGAIPKSWVKILYR